jgi:hypothetical protein
MITTSITFPDSARAFLIDGFFNSDLANRARTLFDKVKTDKINWPDNDIFEPRGNGRALYQGQSSVYDEIINFAGSIQTLEYLGNLIDKKICFAGASVWADFEGYDIMPHYDPPYFTHAAQIFISNRSPQWNDSPMGTSLYQNQNKLWLQLPYRHNFGYFFENSNNLLHGLGVKVPAGVQRNSIHFKYTS